jgi:hypothetical protein
LTLLSVRCDDAEELVFKFVSSGEDGRTASIVDECSEKTRARTSFSVSSPSSRARQIAAKTEVSTDIVRTLRHPRQKRKMIERYFSSVKSKNSLEPLLIAGERAKRGGVGLAQFDW